jgi:MinD-like ATPase involved in chromosome partitioning or flagellar assembly
MKTITFYSYKGGVGRTLVVANVARYLAQFGLKVVALDLDLEAPGLHHKFSLDGAALQHPQGIADYIADFIRDGVPPDDIHPYTVAVPAPRSGSAEITLIPAGNAPAPAYWKSLSQIDWHALLYAADAPGIALFEDLKFRIEAELAPDYLLIDARTGITEMGGIATSLLADVVVALTLTTSEHLEGVRSVMRSINKTRRANGDNAIQLEVALSRLPEAEDDDVRKATKSAVAFLNAPADDPEDTLNVDEALVLHTDSSLQVRERLLIGSEVRGGNDTGLLADYLRLFTRFIPLSSLAPRVQELVEHAMQRLVDDPLATERSLEVLARYTGHPDALRALVRFYRVRQDSERMLAAAARLWAVTGEEDLDLLWTVVHEGFEVAWRHTAPRSPLDFVKDVWQAAGADDAKVGLRLAETLDNFAREDEAVEVALRLFAQHPEEELVAEAVLEHMMSAGEVGEAVEFAKLHADKFAYDSDYLALWARALAESRDESAAREFLADPHVNLGLLRSEAASVLIQVLRVAGRAEEASDLLRFALEQAIASRSWNDLFALAREYVDRGPRWQREFESAIRAGLPDDADMFLRDVRAEVPGWRARVLPYT